MLSSFTLPSSSPPVTNISPNVRGSTNRRSLALLERHDDVGVRLEHHPAVPALELAAHPEMGDPHVAGVEVEQNAFPRRSTFVSFPPRAGR